VLAHRGAGAESTSLGPNSSAVVQGISQSAGISQNQAQQLVSMVMPTALQHLQNRQSSPQQAAGEHARQIAPALASGDHQSVVNAIANLGKGFLQGAPAGRML
jgi:uncharacterized protein YidB (DUF937 family)